jgi:hypothetical protein
LEDTFSYMFTSLRESQSGVDEETTAPTTEQEINPITSSGIHICRNKADHHCWPNQSCRQPHQNPTSDTFTHAFSRNGSMKDYHSTLGHRSREPPRGPLYTLFMRESRILLRRTKEESTGLSAKKPRIRKTSRNPTSECENARDSARFFYPLPNNSNKISRRASIDERHN